MSDLDRIEKLVEVVQSMNESISRISDIIEVLDKRLTKLEEKQKDDRK